MDHDKNVESMLLSCEKNCCDLLQHAAIESSTANVRQAFTSSLNEALSMSDTIYQQMSAKGWYQAETAPQQKLNQLKQKFTPSC